MPPRDTEPATWPTLPPPITPRRSWVVKLCLLVVASCPGNAQLAQHLVNVD